MATYQKLTHSICFTSLFNCKDSIVICHVFLDTLKKIQLKVVMMSKHNKGKEMFSKDMFMVIVVTIIFIRAHLDKTTLGYISCCKLNSCNLKFQFEIVQFFLLRVKLK
jgi:hypothetical protein